MKRFIAIIVTIALSLTCFGSFCMAEEEYGDFGSNNASVDDDLSEPKMPQFNKDYAVCYNDFENVSNYNNSTFPIVDTDNCDYGKAFSIINTSSWAAVDNNCNGKYNWNGKEFSMFGEPVEIGKDYILSYDYYTEPDITYATLAFSFAPQQSAFAVGGDYRVDVAYNPDGSWKTNKLAFTADKPVVGVKCNTLGQRVGSFIDNYLLQKAVKVNIEDSSNTTTISDALENIVSNSENIYYAPLGDNVKFKVNTVDGMKIDYVKNGSSIITENSEGYYEIPELSDELFVKTSPDIDLFESRYYCENGNIYIPQNSSVYNISDGSGMDKRLLSADNSQPEINKDTVLNPGDNVSVVSGSSTIKSYTVKVLGDYDSNGSLTVSDIVAGIDRIINNGSNEDEGRYDMDNNKTINVTDIVLMKSAILLTDNTPYTADEQKLQNMDSYVSDIISRSGINITEADAKNGVVNSGNRAAVANAMKKAIRGEDITICFIGGSITEGGCSQQQPAEGSGITNSFSTENNNYCDWVCKWWEDSFGSYGGRVNKVNAGISATDTVLGIHRMKEDALSKNPDIVIMEYDVNDDPSLEYKQATYEAMVREFLSSGTALIMFSMAQGLGYSSQPLHEPISALYNVPMLSYRNAYFANEKYKFLSTDGIHPNIVGHPLAGLVINSFLQSTYKELSSIGTISSALPQKYVNYNTKFYSGAYMADFSDAIAGNISGVTVKSMGSFVLEKTATSFNYRSYYGVTAAYSESYEPMVIDIKNCKTLFLQMLRSNKIVDGTYMLEIDGEKVQNNTLTCSTGAAVDNSQPEGIYHWASSRLYCNAAPKDITIKIYPTNKSVNGRVTLYSLLLS